MTLDELIATITPEVYERLKKAVEIGKWSNGVKLSKDQREQCLQAIIAYDAKNAPETERIGYIPPKEHSPCGTKEKDEWKVLKFQE